MASRVVVLAFLWPEKAAEQRRAFEVFSVVAFFSVLSPRVSLPLPLGSERTSPRSRLGLAGAFMIGGSSSLSSVSATASTLHLCRLLMAWRVQFSFQHPQQCAL